MRRRSRGLLYGLILLLLAGTVRAEWNPAGFQKWQDSEVDTLFRQRIGGQIASYPNIVGTDTTWAAIDNDWRISGDTMAYNRNDILKAGVWLDGTSIVKVTWEGVEYTVSQRMIKLIWINTATQNWIDVVPSATWTVPAVDSNIISWANVFPGVDYKIRKSNASIGHGILFKKAFLDSAVTLYNQRADSLDIALGNVIEYDLINVDNPDSAMDVGWRKLKQLGRYVFELSEQTVHFLGSGTMPQLSVRQNWIKKGGKLYCVEYVMMSRIKQIHTEYPNAIIWHNDEIVVISGTTNVEDTYIKQDGSGANYGATDPIFSGKTTGIDPLYCGLIRVKNVASELGPGATNISAVCTIYVELTIYNHSHPVFQVFKPWVEGTQNGTQNPPGATWDDWDNDDWEWTTAGCGSADDEGEDNSGDGTGADRKATEESHITCLATDDGVWKSFTISDALAQGWYDETIAENGVVLGAGLTTDYHWFRWASTEDAGGHPPFWTFTYTAGAPPAAGQVIIIGAKNEENSHNPRYGIPPAAWE